MWIWAHQPMGERWNPTLRCPDFHASLSVGGSPHSGQGLRCVRRIERRIAENWKLFTVIIGCSHGHPWEYLDKIGVIQNLPSCLDHMVLGANQRDAY